MLSGGVERVSLKELVDQTISSLAVVTPSNVTVRCQHQEAALFMKTDRAVSVAMVLNELCYNALVHGLPQGGTLTLRTMTLASTALLIEVIDDGCGFGEPAAGPPAKVSESIAVLRQTRTGLGLNLVRDFVTRELRGKFEIISNSDGTTARVEFPLREEELPAADV